MSRTPQRKTRGDRMIDEEPEEPTDEDMAELLGVEAL